MCVLWGPLTECDCQNVWGMRAAVDIGRVKPRVSSEKLSIGYCSQSLIRKMLIRVMND